MSSASEQVDLAGEPVTPQRQARTGIAVILEQANPDVDVARVAQWVHRAREEGVLHRCRGGAHE